MKTVLLQLASVQFHLINTIILLLSREGFRRGCLRVKEASRSLPAMRKVDDDTCFVVAPAKMPVLNSGPRWGPRSTATACYNSTVLACGPHRHSGRVHSCAST